ALVETKALNRSGSHRIDEDVGAPKQFGKPLLAVSALDVEEDVPLAPTHGHPDRIDDVAERRLHFDDIRPLLSEQLTGLGARHHVGELEHPHPFEWAVLCFAEHALAVVALLVHVDP